MSSVIVPNRVNGIDLCYLQDTPPLDAKKIKEAGFEFAYVKSSQYSSTRDNRFNSLVDRLRMAGLAVGAYHFCAHDTDPEKQAEFFFRASEGLGQKPGELPPMIDWEFCTPSKYNPHPLHCVKWLQKFASKAKELWYERVPRFPVIYTYPYYSNGHQPALSEAGDLSKYPLCFASYKGVSDGRGYRLVPWLPTEDANPFAAIPKPWSKWTLWQYSGNNGLKVPGISFDCDRQLFNGTSGEFQDFLGIVKPVHQTELEVKEDAYFRAGEGSVDNG